MWTKQHWRINYRPRAISLTDGTAIIEQHKFYGGLGCRCLPPSIKEMAKLPTTRPRFPGNSSLCSGDACRAQLSRRSLRETCTTCTNLTDVREIPGIRRARGLSHLVGTGVYYEFGLMPFVFGFADIALIQCAIKMHVFFFYATRRKSMSAPDAKHRINS